jgi:hypothetical protein
VGLTAPVGECEYRVWRPLCAIGAVKRARRCLHAGARAAYECDGEGRVCAPYCGDASVCLGWGSCGVVVAIEAGIVDIQNQNNDTKLQCSSVSTSEVSIDDAISICAQMESLVGLVMVRVKDKAEWRQWAMSPIDGD